MDAKGFERVAAAKLSEVTDDGSADQVQWFHQIMDVIRDLVVEYKSALPDRDTFLAGLGSALDRLFAGIDTPGPDVIVEPIIKAIVLMFAGRVYDRVSG